MQDDDDRFLTSFNSTYARIFASIPINVVVMGPRLNGDGTAAELRRVLIDRAKLFGAAIQAEHVDVRKVTKARLGAGDSLTHHEIVLVGHSDLLVIIPSSPGSFCELGFFAMKKELASKMVILTDKTYDGEESYVSEGPVKAAKNNRVLVRSIDYSDHKKAWSIVKKRIEIVRADRIQHKAIG